jgi:hypothetical protein
MQSGEMTRKNFFLNYNQLLYQLSFAGERGCKRLQR